MVGLTICAITNIPGPSPRCKIVMAGNEDVNFVEYKVRNGLESTCVFELKCGSSHIVDWMRWPGNLVYLNLLK